MSRLLVKLKYIGTNYVGWQVQKNGLSIQQCVQDAIEKVYGSRVDVTGCSRTDSGVHANGYCFCFNPPKKVDPFRVPLSLNSALPEDISAVECIEVDDNFHPRYDAVAKEYVYKLYDGRLRNPFLDGLTYHYIGKMDTALVNCAAKYFVGTHDFRAFMANGSKIEDTVRTIYYCFVSEKEDYIEFKICGNGFLYNMVRIIMGTLIAVNEKKILPEDVKWILESKSRDNAGKTAPAIGLYLNRVYYDMKEVDCFVKEA